MALVFIYYFSISDMLMKWSKEGFGLEDPLKGNSLNGQG
jgi:hypothetical protein